MTQPKFIRRTHHASGAVVLAVRSKEDEPWIEVAAAPPDDPAALAELDRLQRVCAEPLVREVFAELNTVQD